MEVLNTKNIHLYFMTHLDSTEFEIGGLRNLFLSWSRDLTKF